ncbi:unnamed protein product [Amoebophrya sp. A120]|nr:unnamed protein product [Amoebophrya sp. A120]|eukprot:GSA120T00014158001.1
MPRRGLLGRASFVLDSGAAAASGAAGSSAPRWPGQMGAGLEAQRVSSADCANPGACDSWRGFLAYLAALPSAAACRTR